jgi:hypothetical protein
MYGAVHVLPACSAITAQPGVDRANRLGLPACCAITAQPGVDRANRLGLPACCAITAQPGVDRANNRLGLPACRAITAQPGVERANNRLGLLDWRPSISHAYCNIRANCPTLTRECKCKHARVSVSRDIIMPGPTL